MQQGPDHKNPDSWELPKRDKIIAKIREAIKNPKFHYLADGGALAMSALALALCG